jgi:hypothetical protein
MCGGSYPLRAPGWRLLLRPGDDQASAISDNQMFSIASIAMLEQVAINEPGKGERDKQGSRDGIKLPVLISNLSGPLLKKQCNTTDKEVKNDQLKQAQPK